MSTEADAATGDEVRIDPDGWAGPLHDIAGPQIIVGGPGTGKTEFLVRRAVHLLETAGVPTSSILILSFGRRGVADLRERIRRSAGSVGDLDVATFHSFAMRLIEAYGHSHGWQETPQVLTGPEQLALVAELLAEESGAEWSPAYRGILHSRTFAQEVTDFVLRAAEQLLDAGDIAAMGRDDWRGIPQFLLRYDEELKRRSRLDYGTLLREAVRLVDGRVIDEGALPRYILVDEYQDTTLAQARLLRVLSSAERNLTVAADPYQSVYSFRGARLENVADFPAEFRHPSGSPGKRIVLTTSFRTPRTILDSAVNVTARRLPGAAGPVVPAPAAGRVDVHIFGQQTEEAEWVAAEVARIHLTQDVALNQIGVLVRSKRRFLPDLSRSLERRGIPHDLPDSRLSDHPAVRFVLDLITAANDADRPVERTRAIRRILLGPMYRLPLGGLRSLERQRASGVPWAEALRTAGLHKLSGLISDNEWATGMPAAQGAWEVWSQLDEAVAIATEPERQDDRLAWRSLVQVLDRWNARNPRATLADYRRLTESEEFEAQPLLSFRRADSDRLTVTTLHQAKGLEFNTVFLCDAVEGVFPDLRPRDSLLGVRHLMDHLPTDPSEYTAFRLQEERRLAYTAMTRARSRAVWTATSVGAEAGRGVPSRFLPLVAGVATLGQIETKRPDRPAPVSPREAEADLRRVSADPTAAPPQRLAAITQLAAGPRWGMRSPELHFGVATRGSDRGLNGTPLQLSPSQADGYAKCPRRYAIERKLRQAGDSVYARFGSLIHDVVDRVESAAMARGEPHGDLTSAVDQLNQIMDPADFGGEPIATAWRRRALDGLERLYSMWPSDARAVALERNVAFELAGITWRGRIDRVEAGKSGLRVVDYKTSRTPVSRDEAAGSLQLGFYALAVAADPELLAHGEPTAAEFWYPLAPGKRSLATRQLDMSQLPAIGQRLIELGSDIAEELWDPRPSEWCERCPFSGSCPARPEGGDQFR